MVHISAVERVSRKPLTLSVHPVPPDVPARFAGRPSDVRVREHLNIYLTFDVSGSMYAHSKDGTPLDQARKAAEQFVNQCDLTTTSIGLIVFSDKVHLEQTATQNNKKIMDAIGRLPSVNTGSGNDTDPFDEIYQCFSRSSGICYAIVLADGRWSHQREAIIKAKRCHEEGIEIIAIGFGGADREFLKRIASSSEQSFFTDVNKLVETFSTIAQELTERSGGWFHKRLSEPGA